MIKKLLLLISLTLIESATLKAMTRPATATQTAQTRRKDQGAYSPSVLRKRLLLNKQVRITLKKRRALIGKQIRNWLWRVVPDRTDEDLGGYCPLSCAIL